MLQRNLAWLEPLPVKLRAEEELMAELPAFSAAIHPTQACWAYSGRSSKLAIRPIASIETSSEDAESSTANANGTAAVGKGSLGGEGKVVIAGKGKFGMDVKFVRPAQAYISSKGNVSLTIVS